MDHGSDDAHSNSQPGQSGEIQHGAYSTGGGSRAGTTPRFRGGPGSAQRGSRGAASRGGSRGASGFRGTQVMSRQLSFSSVQLYTHQFAKNRTPGKITQQHRKLCQNNSPHWYL